MPDYIQHCLELLAPLGPTRARRMFGGFGLYADDVFVAIVQDEQLYLKVDDTTRGRFEAAGCQPFIYDAAGKSVSLGYWTAPDEAVESPALMVPWARLAFEAALRARNKPGKAAKATQPAKPASRRRPTR